MKRLFFLILGCICLALGCIGIVLPILPTVPFFLVTVFCFANSSRRLHDWFLSTPPVSKASGFLCATAWHDSFYKRWNPGLCHAADDGWIRTDAAEGALDPLRNPCGGVAVPCDLFRVWCENHSEGMRRSGTGRGQLRSVLVRKPMGASAPCKSSHRFFCSGSLRCETFLNMWKTPAPYLFPPHRGNK